jgi:hypothetical protein
MNIYSLPLRVCVCLYVYVCARVCVCVRARAYACAESTGCSRTVVKIWLVTGAFNLFIIKLHTQRIIDYDNDSVAKKRGVALLLARVQYASCDGVKIWIETHLVASQLWCMTQNGLWPEWFLDWLPWLQ